MRRITKGPASTIMGGFTLIEVLVVIAIAAIIMAVASASYTTAQKQARDARRQNDIKDIQTAFEQYYSENSVYPISPTNVFTGNAFPTDPKNATPYTYDFSRIDLSGYCICALFETKTGNADAATSAICNWNNSSKYYCIQNQQ